MTIPDFHLLDIDGCLAHSASHNWPFSANSLKVKSYDNKTVFENAHQALFKRIKPSDVLLCASTRTSAFDDYCIAQKNRTLSLAEYMKAAQKATGAMLDTFLFGDIANINERKPNAIIQDHNQPGDSWKEIERVNAEPRKRPKFKLSYQNDEHKRLLLYAIVQYIANKYDINKNNPTTINFYDDRAHDIIPMAAEFFKQYPKLLPEGVTLKLWGYTLTENYNNYNQDLSKPLLLQTIEGAGTVHPNFYGALHNVAQTQFSRTRHLGTYSDSITDTEIQALEHLGPQQPSHTIDYHQYECIHVQPDYTHEAAAYINVSANTKIFALLVAVLLIEAGLFALIGLSVEGELGLAFSKSSSGYQAGTLALLTVAANGGAAYAAHKHKEEIKDHIVSLLPSI